MSVSDLTFQGEISHFTYGQKSIKQPLEAVDTPNYDSRDVDSIESHYDRIIEGWANTNAIDRVNDVVDPEAFQKSIETYRMNPILRYNHKTGEVVGKVLELKIVPDKGLWIKAQVAKGTPEADKVWKLILQGALRAFSIYGKIVSKGQKRTSDGKVIQNVTEFDLQEIAVVDVPANQESIFQIVSKGVNRMSKAEEQTYAQSTSAMKGVDDMNRGSERGNEQLSTETQVEKMLNRVVQFQQKSLEVLLTLAEGQAATTEKLNSLADLVGKSMEGSEGNDLDFDFDTEAKGYEEEDEEKMDEEEDEEKEMEEDDEDSEKSLKAYEKLSRKINATATSNEINALRKEVATLKRLIKKGDEEDDEEDAEKESDDEEDEEKMSYRKGSRKGEEEDEEEKEYDDEEEKEMSDDEEEKEHSEDHDEEEKEHSEDHDEEEKADDEEEDDEEKYYGKKSAKSATSKSVRDVNVEEGVQKALVRANNTAKSNGQGREVGAALRAFLQKSI